MPYFRSCCVDAKSSGKEASLPHPAGEELATEPAAFDLSFIRTESTAGRVTCVTVLGSRASEPLRAKRSEATKRCLGVLVLSSSCGLRQYS